MANMHLGRGKKGEQPQRCSRWLTINERKSLPQTPQTHRDKNGNLAGNAAWYLLSRNWAKAKGAQREGIPLARRREERALQTGRV